MTALSAREHYKRTAIVVPSEGSGPAMPAWAASGRICDRLGVARVVGGSRQESAMFRSLGLSIHGFGFAGR